MKIILSLAVAAALAVPAAAFAGKAPKPHTQHGKAQPKVMYVLKGTLSTYTAASAGGNGSITIAVSHSNRHGHALVGQSVTIALSAQTKIVLQSGSTTIADGDNGIVKIRAARNVAAADLLTTLGAGTAFQVVDQGAPSTSSTS